MLQQVMLHYVLLLFTLYMVSGHGNHVPSEKPYKCKQLFSIDDAEIKRIRLLLPEFKKNKFDLVVLNYTVGLDCLYDEEMKYVRHYLVTPKGKAILRFAVEAVYFPLKLFGLKSTIANVNVSPVDINNTSNKPNVYALLNLTHLSQVWTIKNGFETLCFSSKVDADLNFMLHLFIPKSAVLDSNGIYCYKDNNSTEDPSELKSSEIVYAVYAVSLVVCLHINLFNYLLLEDTYKWRETKLKYHSGETPYSIRRLVLYLKYPIYGLNKHLEGRLDKRRRLYQMWGMYVCIVFTFLIPYEHLFLYYGHAWRENIIFINDYDALVYTLNTNDGQFGRPNTLAYVVICLLYIGLCLLYFVYALIFFKATLKPTNIVFNIVKPTFAFTSKLDERPKANPTKFMSATAHFGRSYRQLFSRTYWGQIIDLCHPWSESKLVDIASIVDERIEEDTSKTVTMLIYILISCLRFPLLAVELCVKTLGLVVNLLMNIGLGIIQALFPVLKFFLTGFTERMHRKVSIGQRFLYCIYGLLAYVIIWCAANVFIFHIVALAVSFLLYITVVAIPFNPIYGVPLMVIMLSVVKYLFIFYEDFQSDYKSLLDTIFEILDDHFVKEDVDLEISDTDIFDFKKSYKIRRIKAELFDQCSKKYIPKSINAAFLFLKLAFACACIIIAFQALEESDSGIETLKFSDLFSVILLVFIPGILQHFVQPRTSLQRKVLYFKLLRYLKSLNRNHELQDLVEYNKWIVSRDCNTDKSESDSSSDNIEDSQTNEHVEDGQSTGDTVNVTIHLMPYENDYIR